MHTLPKTPACASPYVDALHWIEHEGYGTGSAVRPAKLVLSLYDSDKHPWSVRECIDGLDDQRLAMVMAMVGDFAKWGETNELRDVGARICKLEPGLVELGKAMMDARCDVRRRRDREREAEAVRAQANSEQPERDWREGRGEPLQKPLPLRKPGQLRART